jgi:replicative DNA helicase
MPLPADEVAAGARVPPQSEEAERAVLGAVLMDSERVLDLCVERQIVPECFYHGWHRALYEFFLQMKEEGRPIDLFAAAQRLRDLGRLDGVGGNDYLERLLGETPTSAHAEYYIDIVRQKHLLRLVIQRSRDAMDACYKGEEDADGILDRAEQSFFDISEVQRSTTVAWSAVINETMEQVEHMLQLRKDITGLPTGYLDLDRVTRGLQRGDLIIIAARPSMGKTSLAMNVAENVALGRVADHLPRPVAIFSLEMSREALAKRMLFSHAGVASTKSYLSTDDHGRLVQAADVLRRAEIYVDDSAGLSPVELRARARRLRRKHKIELIVVDYLQMMNFPQLAREGRQREVSAISNSLKAMAKELRVPVMVLSQLNRSPETRDRTAVPKLSDLRDSGSIEQDADVVALLRRPCKYPEDERFADKRLAILDIAKQRNGPTREIEMDFEEEFTRFGNRTHGVDPADGVAPSSGEI